MILELKLVVGEDGVVIIVGFGTKPDILKEYQEEEEPKNEA